MGTTALGFALVTLAAFEPGADAAPPIEERIELRNYLEVSQRTIPLYCDNSHSFLLLALNTSILHLKCCP